MITCLDNLHVCTNWFHISLYHITLTIHYHLPEHGHPEVWWITARSRYNTVQYNTRHSNHEDRTQTDAERTKDTKNPALITQPVTSMSYKLGGLARKLAVLDQDRVVFSTNKTWPEGSTSICSIQIRIWTLHLEMYNWRKSGSCAKNSEFLC